jgi:uncharacterized protein YacL
MSQTGTTQIPPAGLWSLKLGDIWKGLLKSCGGLLVGLLMKMIQNKFQLPTYEEVIPLLEATAYFFVGYLGINYASNNVGEPFTKNKPTVVVEQKKLEEKEEKIEELKQEVKETKN